MSFFPAKSVATHRSGGGSPPSAVSVSGTVEVGGTLTCAATGATSYQWKRAATFGGGGAYSSIGGATSSTYTVVAADIGYDIKCTAINGAGSTDSSNSLRTAALETYLGTTCKFVLDERNQVYSGSNLSTWTAAGSSGVVFNGTVAPQSGRSINGYAAPDFNGTTMYCLQATGGVDVSSITSAGASWTTYSVLIADTVPAVSSVMAGAAVLGDGGNWVNFLEISNKSAGGNKAYVAVWDGAEKVAGDSITTGSAFLFEGIRSSGTDYARIGAGTQQSIASGAPGNMTNGIRLGYLGAGTSFFDGCVAFLLHCDTALSTTQKNTVRAWCANKYGVTA